jgi:hypothetical protein
MPAIAIITPLIDTPLPMLSPRQPPFSPPLDIAATYAIFAIAARCQIRHYRQPRCYSARPAAVSPPLSLPPFRLIFAISASALLRRFGAADFAAADADCPMPPAFAFRDFARYSAFFHSRRYAPA